MEYDKSWTKYLTIQNKCSKDVVWNIQINTAVRNYIVKLRSARRTSGIWIWSKFCAPLDLHRNQKKQGNRNLRKNYCYIQVFINEQHNRKDVEMEWNDKKI